MPVSAPASSPLDVERFRRLAAPSRLAHDIVARGTVTSTNSVARELGRTGAADGTLVVAEEQTTGRGRRQRRWESPAGLGLYASLLLRPPDPSAEYAAAVQLAAGIAVAEALGQVQPHTSELIWPNDCYCLGQKVAGVLVEAEAMGPQLEFLVCGIGINVNQRRVDFSPQLSGATSARLLAGRVVDREELLARLVTSMQCWDDVARDAGLQPVIDRWLMLSPAATDSIVDVRTHDGVLRGRSAGLSSSGGLNVIADGRTHEVGVGELVRVRRRW